MASIQANQWEITRVRSVLANGGLIAYPTEAVWGLGCDPFNRLAIKRLLSLKQRPANKGLILVAADYQQIAPLLSNLGLEQQQRLQASLDDPTTAPTTWLLPHGGAFPAWITGGRDKVAIRVSKHPLVAQLCRAHRGLLVSTSANPSGQSPAKNRAQTKRYFGSALDLYLKGQVGGESKPSTILDLESGSVIR